MLNLFFLAAPVNLPPYSLPGPAGGLRSAISAAGDEAPVGCGRSFLLRFLIK